MKENVIKMARLMVGCKDRTCEDCLSQSKKLFGDNKCALIEYAEVLDKAGYRKQSDTVKEFAEKVKFGMAQFGYYFCGSNGVEYFGDIQVNDFTKMINNLAEQYGKED